MLKYFSKIEDKFPDINDINKKIEEYNHYLLEKRKDFSMNMNNYMASVYSGTIDPELEKYIEQNKQFAIKKDDIDFLSKKYSQEMTEKYQHNSFKTIKYVTSKRMINFIKNITIGLLCLFNIITFFLLNHFIDLICPSLKISGSDYMFSSIFNIIIFFGPTAYFAISPNSHLNNIISEDDVKKTIEEISKENHEKELIENLHNNINFDKISIIM